MTTLEMIKVWDHNDSNLFISESYRFTAEGLKKYWMSADSAIRYWVTALSNKKGKEFTQKGWKTTDPKVGSLQIKLVMISS